MATNIGPRIGIDGYASYKAEMQSIIAQINNYKAQCDALSNSEEDLRKKQELQSEQIKLQTDLLIKQSEWNAKVRQAVDDKKVITEQDTAVLQANETALLNQETELTKLTTEYNKTTAELDAFNDEQQEAGETAETSSDKISGATIALGELMAEVVKKGVELTKQAAELGIEYNASMETYTAAFSTLLGSTEEAEAAIASIRELSKGIPTFSTAGLTKATQMLVATGVDAETATEDVKALANAVAASGGGNPELERMAQNLQQIGNAGKATKMDIRQFAYAGINVTRLLADYTGKTTEEVENMTVTYELLTGALKYAAEEGGAYFGGLEAQADTYNGQISALKKNVEEGLGYAFSGLTDKLESTVLPKLNEFFSDTDNIDGLINLIEDFGVAAASFATATKFTEFVKDNKTAVGLLTGQISAAEAATGLWNTALSALPFAVVAGGVVLFKNALKEFNEEADSYKNSLISENENLESVQTNLASVREEYEKWQSENVGWNSQFMGTDKQRQQAKGFREAIAELEKQEAEFMVKEAEVAAMAANPQAKLNSYVEVAKMRMDELKAAYDEAYDSAMKAALKQFDLFEDVGELSYTSTKDLGKNLQSQIDYWEMYAANLEYVSDAQYGLSKELISFLSDGTTDSAGYLQSIVADINNAGGITSEKGHQIVMDLNAKFNELQNAQEDYAGETAATLTNLAEEMNKTVDGAIEKMKDLDLSEEMYTDAVNSMKKYKQGIIDKTPSLQERAYLTGQEITISMQNGINSIALQAPTLSISMGGGGKPIVVQGSHAKGLDYVPEDNYIAALHKGEMVLTAAQANAIRSGAYQQSIANKTLNYGGVSVNVYAAEGQREDEIADKVAYILQHAVDRKESVYR